MNAINLDTQIVGSSYDAANRTCSYIYQHLDGSRYTVTIPLDELNKLRPNRANMRNFVGRTIMNHVQSHAPDRENKS